MNLISADPKKCQFNDKCNDFNKYNVKNDCVKLKDLVNDVGPLFGADVVLLEHNLIRLRSATLIDLNSYICEKHRFILGEGFRPSPQCSYFEPPPTSTALGRKVRWDLYKYVKSLDKSFVLGSLICKNCITKLNSVIKQEPVEEESDDNMETDPDFVPPVLIIDENERQCRRQKLDSLSEILETDRIQYQIASDIEVLSDVSLKYFRSKYQEMQNSLTKKFCSFVAPGQEQELLNFLNIKQEIAIEADSVVNI